MPRSNTEMRGIELGLALLATCLIILPGLTSFTLIDPWEGHYAEVGRRILSDNDWIALRWQSDAFHSKPALTPWLIAASMKLHGLATDGGYSGELVASPALTLWAVRLPFALFGIAGIMSLWLALRRLVSRRAAWIGLVVLATMPFYYLVSKQAITDMPMVASSTGALCCFALAVMGNSDKLSLVYKRLSVVHILLACIAVVSLLQLLYGVSYFQNVHALGPGMHKVNAIAWVTVPTLAALALLLVLTLWVWPARTTRDAYLVVAYALIGISVLAKGPPGAVLVVLVALSYLVVTKDVRLLFRLRPLEGLLIIFLIAVPWHVAIALRDGQPFLTEYIGHHWLKRAGLGANGGVHMVNRAGEGTFTYFASQLGYGLWPFIGILPAAMLSAWKAGYETTKSRMQVFGLLWAVAGLVLFTVIRTKYHHYILPAVPGFAIVIAIWLDEVTCEPQKIRRLAILIGVVVSLCIGYELTCHQSRLIELFTYRYDRLWPSAAPWNLDLSSPLLWFALLFALSCLLLLSVRFARFAVLGLLAASAAFSFFLGNVYMPRAAPHWGQGQLHEQYYAERAIQSVRLDYASNGALLHDWPESRQTLTIKSVVPETMAMASVVNVEIRTPSTSAQFPARIASFTSDGFVLKIDSADWKLDFADVSAQPGSPPKITVIADPLIAWNLHWRSELFWSGGELWSTESAGHRMFEQGHDKEFAKLLTAPEFRDRTVYVITAVNQESRLRMLLPSAIAKRSLEAVEKSSNKYRLYRFRNTISQASR